MLIKSHTGLIKKSHTIHNTLIQILNSEKKKRENLIIFRIEGKFPLKGRENPPTIELLICMVDIEGHWNKIRV